MSQRVQGVKDSRVRVIRHRTSGKKLNNYKFLNFWALKSLDSSTVGPFDPSTDLKIALE